LRHITPHATTEALITTSGLTMDSARAIDAPVPMAISFTVSTHREHTVEFHDSSRRTRPYTVPQFDIGLLSEFQPFASADTTDNAPALRMVACCHRCVSA